MSRAAPPDRSTPPLALPTGARPSTAAPAPPVPLTSFVGRAPDTALVAKLLRRPDVRLVTVTGPAGVGKTRLALRAIAELGDPFADGISFVALAAVRDPELVLPTVAHQLGVPGAPDRSVLARLQTFLAERHQLLVLDNLEHLLAAAPSVAELVAGSPRLTVLGTSRSPLNVSGEHLVPLAPLPLEEARQLFGERVQARLPAYALTDADRPTVDAICERLDRLPLAIELAAARVPVLPPPALLAQLAHRLDVLTQGPRDAPDRLRDMREAIAWSVDLLTDAQRSLFRRLGVFVGGFTLAAAQAVGPDGTNILDGVSALVAANLVHLTAGVADESRYMMLETIRAYALEQLGASGEADEVRRLHADYYRSLAESAIPLYDGPEARLALDRVEAELDNCRAAMGGALDAHDAETGIRLAGALWRVWWYSEVAGAPAWAERITEGRAWLDRALAMDDGLPAEAVTEAYLGAAAMARLQDDLARHHELSQDLLARAQSENYPYGSYWALIACGINADVAGDNATARSCFEQMLAIAPALRDPENHAAIALLNLANSSYRSRHLDEAADHLRESLELSRETGNARIRATAASKLGRVRREQGHIREAAELISESIVVFFGIRDLQRVHVGLVDLALVALAAGQPEHGARMLGAAAHFPRHPYDVMDGEPPAPSDADAVERACSLLGAAEFDAASAAGKDLAWEAVLDEIDALTALAHDSTAPEPPSPASEHGLTRRETEVLGLLADGRSNRAIAEILSLSERTVENHVLHILTKLDLDSRTAAATYAVRHGLA